MAKVTKQSKAGRESILEFTIKSVLAGSIFGIIFGAANAYLGLRVGMTVSTSIPISVLSVAIFRLGRSIWGPSTLLETNMSQTIGSASSSVASGIIFTVPALFLWSVVPSWFQMGMLGLMGGILGTLAMVPLRRILIVNGGDELTYPEGTACAEVLKSTDAGSAHSKWIFIGLLVGIGIKLLFGLLALFPSELVIPLAFLKNAQLALEVSPALIGVGYIMGYRVASTIVAGTIISFLVLIPLITQFGTGLTAPYFPESTLLISAMGPGQIWSRYIRYIGAGTVAVGGIITVIRTFPTITQSMKRIWQDSRKKAGAGRNVKSDRLDTDISPQIIVFGILGVVATIAFVPGILSGGFGLGGRILAAVGVGMFGLLFATVSSRIVGLVGVSSNPTSGMTIVTLLSISALFAFLGWNDLNAKAAVLTVGSLVAIAASIAGDTSQDLKTGQLVGATPYKQQYGQLIGVATACWAVAGTMALLGETYGFGSKELPAPQATLMKTVIDGVLSGELPWNLVFTGGMLGFSAFLAGLSVLPFALGIYLPMATNLPIFVGGLIRKWTSSSAAKGEDDSEDPGILCASGLIAGEGLAGVAIAAYAATSGTKPGAEILVGGIGGELGAAMVLFAIITMIVVSAKSRR